MANRYAIQSFHYRNTVTGHDEFVHQGALRDSTHQSVVQLAAYFQATPVAPPAVTGVLAQYMLANPTGP